MTNKPRVLILGGGPDAEREVSINSASAVHQACLDAGLDATLLIVDRPTIDEIRAWETDVVFPALHGRFGEGGPFQQLLEQAGLPFVGSPSGPARLAMDKMGTKLVSSRCGIPTPDASIFEPVDEDDSTTLICPLEFPVVIKPVADGSSVGLFLCHDQTQWDIAAKQVSHDLAEHPERVYMIERLIQGIELTVSVLETEQGTPEALPIIEIAPAQGVYDFEAKYTRIDTRYTPNPDLPDGIADGLKGDALKLSIALGIRHLARVDFILDRDGQYAMLELNTMPGFTKSSLMPMAARAAGIEMPELCDRLIQCALNDHTKSNMKTSTSAPE